MPDQIKSSSRSWPNLAALACVLFGTILVGGVTPAIASPKRVIIIEYPGAGFPPLIDAGRPDCMKVASVGETPPYDSIAIPLGCETWDAATEGPRPATSPTGLD